MHIEIWGVGQKIEIYNIIHLVTMLPLLFLHWSLFLVSVHCHISPLYQDVPPYSMRSRPHPQDYPGFRFQHTHFIVESYKGTHFSPSESESIYSAQISPKVQTGTIMVDSVPGADSPTCGTSPPCASIEYALNQRFPSAGNTIQLAMG